MKEDIISVFQNPKNRVIFQGGSPYALDIIEEIKGIRMMLKEYYLYVQDNTSDTQYDADGWLANLDADTHLYLWKCGMLNEK